MGAIEKESFVWASLGIMPQREEDMIYQAGEQPIAEAVAGLDPAERGVSPDR